MTPRTKSQDAFYELAHTLNSLLEWAIEPWPRALPENWAEGEKRGVSHAARLARNLTTDDALVEKIFAANRKGQRFVDLLQKHPTISAIPVEEWSVPAYRKLFDDIAALRDEFEQLAKTDAKPKARGGTSQNSEKIPRSREPLTQALLNHQFNQCNSGKSMEVINEEFFRQNKSKLGKTDADRRIEFARIKGNAQRCTRKAKRKT